MAPVNNSRFLHLISTIHQKLQSINFSLLILSKGYMEEFNSMCPSVCFSGTVLFNYYPLNLYLSIFCLDIVSF